MVRWNPLTRQPKPPVPEFPKQNQTIITGGGFHPGRYYDKSQIDALLASLSGGGSDWSEWDSVDLTDSIIDLLTGGMPIDLGTDAFALFLYRKTSKWVKGYIFAVFASDNSVGTAGASVWMIPGSALPEFMSVPGGPFGYPSFFGYMSMQPVYVDDVLTEPGGLGSSAPVGVDFSGGADPESVANLGFVGGLPKETIFGYEGLVGNGNPFDVTGREATLQGYVEYPIDGTIPLVSEL